MRQATEWFTPYSIIYIMRKIFLFNLMLCCALATGAQTLDKLGKVNIAPKQETIKKNNMELLSTYSFDLPMVAKKHVRRITMQLILKF